MNKKKDTYYTYVLSNTLGTSYYVGVSNDLKRRVREHKEGIASLFTKKYKVTRLMYCEEFHYVNDAIAREKQLKRWSRKKKVELVRRVNHSFEEVVLE